MACTCVGKKFDRPSVNHILKKKKKNKSTYMEGPTICNLLKQTWDTKHKELKIALAKKYTLKRFRSFKNSWRHRQCTRCNFKHTFSTKNCIRPKYFRCIRNTRRREGGGQKRIMCHLFCVVIADVRGTIYFGWQRREFVWWHCSSEGHYKVSWTRLYHQHVNHER